MSPQVTLPPIAADELVSKPFGPYMFREAQVLIVCVIKMLSIYESFLLELYISLPSNSMGRL